MARMIPDIGPIANDSHRAEPDIYWRLKKQLDESFIVIHSIPWISTKAREIDHRDVPTGEIDFLILHPIYGILALEVKGGVIAFERTTFVYRDGRKLQPVKQLRRGVHSLQPWIQKQGFPFIRIGYGIVLPDSDLGGKPVPPALMDINPESPKHIVFDKTSLKHFGKAVMSLMQYWKQALAVKDTTAQIIDQIVDLICPMADYTQRWSTRILSDAHQWLTLTDEQQKHLDRMHTQQRMVLTGRSGTGKTLLALTHARSLANNALRVLFVVFNVELAQYLKDQLNDTTINVTTFHKLCTDARRMLGLSVSFDNNWFHEAPKVFQLAVDAQQLGDYDALIIDEGQVFKQEWLLSFTQWFIDKPILICCDETQVFSYESKIPASEIAQIINVPNPFTLSMNLRSPRSVFDRLCEVLPSDYEQISPRPYEPDTLRELGTEYPLHTLFDLIYTLHNDG